MLSASEASLSFTQGRLREASRLWNNEVLNNMSGVWEVIRENCLSHPPFVPPIKGGEGINRISMRILFIPSG